jgi:hypothetical protein
MNCEICRVDILLYVVLHMLQPTLTTNATITLLYIYAQTRALRLAVLPRVDICRGGTCVYYYELLIVAFLVR